MCSRTIGEYNLLKPIGKGAFSDVFLAEHKPTQTYAAVKQISKDSSLVIEHLDQLKYEISIMKKCQHPYISKFYEVLEDDVNIYITQEYLENGNLLSYFNSKQDIDEDTIKKLFIQILYAVQYLHNEIKVIHRDLKMENILLDQNNNVRITDFGLCCPIINDKKSSDESMNGGSPAYVAPELILGQKYTESVDVWALGIILFAMVHTYLPYDDPNLNRLFRKIISLNVKCKKDLNPQIADLIERMLEKDPEKRITISQIIEHPWVMPALSLYNPEIPLSFIDDDWIYSKIKDLGYNPEIAKKAVENNDNTKSVILYNILHRNLLKRLLARGADIEHSIPRLRSVPALAKGEAFHRHTLSVPKEGSRSAKVQMSAPLKTTTAALHIRRNSLNSTSKQGFLGKEKDVGSSLTPPASPLISGSPQKRARTSLQSPIKETHLHKQNRNSLPVEASPQRTPRKTHFQ